MLAMVNIFSDNIDELAEFYGSLFALEELSEGRTAIFRGFRAGGCYLGFNDRKAYELLGLEDGLGAQGTRVLLTFEVSHRSAVQSVAERAIEKGGVLLKAPFETRYGWYQAVVKDPQGNAFRVNKAGADTAV
jgi:predicted enzyme related to lactoylglutathione lyase